MSMGNNKNAGPDLSSNLFDLIQNAELYSERLQQLKDAEAAAKEAEESLGLAQQGRLALNSAQVIRAAADEALAAANGKAKEITSEATKKAKEVVDAAEAEAARVAAATKAAQDTLDKLNDSISAVEEDIAKQREAAKQVSLKAAAEMEAALALKADYTERVKKLKALL